MKNSIYLWVFLALLIFVIVGRTIQKHRLENIKSSPVKYAYGYFNNEMESRYIIYIRSLKRQRDSIERYYNDLENYINEPYLPNNIRLNAESINTKLYITRYSKDSVFAKFHAFYDGPPSRIIPRHTKGWIMVKYLHDEPGSLKKAEIMKKKDE